MKPSTADVGAFIDGVTPQPRQEDACTLLALLQRITGEKPVLWDSIVGFGAYHYRYSSGREGDAPAAGFSPRKAASTIYLPEGVAPHASALDKLGPHTLGVGCLYIKRLQDVDTSVLESIIRTSYDTVTDGTFGQRAER